MKGCINCGLLDFVIMTGREACDAYCYSTGMIKNTPIYTDTHEIGSIGSVFMYNYLKNKKE